MFVTLAPRLATSFAITLGTVAGGVLALMYTPPPADLVAEAPRPADERIVARAESEASEHARPAAATPSGPAPAAAAPPTAAAPEPTKDLTPSPHDSPLLSEVELRKSERLCIRELPDECVRVADAYAAGKIIEFSKRRAFQYKNLAFRGYINACEKNQPEACYALARMYLHGDGVAANPSYAENLMRRVVEVCRYRDAPMCQRLAQEAPVPPKPKRR